MSDTVKDVLAERGARYGSFETHANIAQRIKLIILPQGKHLPSIMLEGLEMIAHKLARIANGDPYYSDSWVDIAGYATLVANYLKELEDADKAINEATSFEPSDGLKIPGLTDKSSLPDLQSAATGGNTRNSKRRN